MTVEEYNKSIDLYSDNVYRFILKNIKNKHEAEDIVQDTAYHTMIDKIRKSKRNSITDDFESFNITHTESYSDLNAILHEALNRLPEIQRSVILLRDYEGYAYNEIAEITGLNESQVKVYIYRGRLALKEYIGKIETLI